MHRTTPHAPPTSPAITSGVGGPCRHPIPDPTRPQMRSLHFSKGWRAMGHDRKAGPCPEAHQGQTRLFSKIPTFQCRDEFDSLHGGRTHNPCRRSVQSTSSTNTTAASQMGTPFTATSLIGNRVTLLYPGRPSCCPIENCMDGFSTFDTVTGAITSTRRHLHESHLIKAEKFWRCSICGLSMIA